MTEEEKKVAKQKEFEFQTGARVYGYLSDVVLQRYGIEWTRIGNMQSSAGALLTVISIASALGFGSSFDASFSVKDYSCFVRVGFTLDFLLSVAYFLVAVICMIPILRSKQIAGLSTPSELKSEVEKSLNARVKSSVSYENDVYVLNFLAKKIDGEIIGLRNVLAHNKVWYHRCMTASFLSLGTNVVLMLFKNVHIISGSVAACEILAVFGFLALAAFCLIVI